MSSPSFVVQSINRLFAYCKGGNFNINIISGRGLAILCAKQGKSGSNYNFGEEKISCLGRTNTHAFHENFNTLN